MLNLTGQKFGKLIVLKFNGKNHHNHGLWLCRCECGNLTIKNTSQLRSGHTKSCGCLRSRQGGESCTRIYRIWKGILYRTKTKKAYKKIAVCKQWREFKTFKSWALENGYADTLTIDRIDSNGAYSPENCRWISLEENSRRASQKLFTISGMTKNIAQWAEFIGLSQKWMWEYHAKYGDASFVKKIEGFMSWSKLPSTHA